MSLAAYVDPAGGQSGARCIALGDSITYQAQSLGTPAGSITDVLNTLGWSVSWNGYPGDNWGDHDVDLIDGAQHGPPTVALLLFGTNDALRYPVNGDRDAAAEALCWRATRWLEHYRSTLGIPVVMMTLSERTLDAGSNQLAPRFNDWMRKRVARLTANGETGVGVLDWAQIVNDAHAAGEDVLDQYALHPNALGRERWRDALLAAIDSI